MHSSPLGSHSQTNQTNQTNQTHQRQKPHWTGKPEPTPEGNFNGQLRSQYLKGGNLSEEEILMLGDNHSCA